MCVRIGTKGKVGSLRVFFFFGGRGVRAFSGHFFKLPEEAEQQLLSQAVREAVHISRPYQGLDTMALLQTNNHVLPPLAVVQVVSM